MARALFKTSLISLYSLGMHTVTVGSGLSTKVDRWGNGWLSMQCFKQLGDHLHNSLSFQEITGLWACILRNPKMMGLADN